MEAGRGRVGLVGELTAGMKAGEDDLDGGQARLAVKVDRDAAAVVFDGAGSVLVQGDGDARTETVGGFVHAVIDDFPDQVMEARGVGGPDVHPRAFANTLHVGKDFDVAGIIGIVARHKSC